jgi:protoporphyrinogen oxidase
MREYDEIVVGGGIAGLYYAYELSKREPNKKVMIMEKEEIWGGRIQTHYFKFQKKSYQIEAGAGRFNQNHKLLIQLIQELGFEKQIIPIPSKTIFLPTYPLQHYDANKLMNRVRTFSLKDRSTDQDEMTYLQYAKKILTPNEIKFLKDSFGYTSELTQTNARYAIHLFYLDFRHNIQFYILQKGFSQIIIKLTEYLKKKGYKMNLKSDLKDIEYDGDFYTCKVNKNGKMENYKTKRLILAVPKPTLMKMRILKVLNLQSIECIPLLRYYVIYPKEEDGKVWFDDLTKTTTNHGIRYIIPVNKETGMIMVSYTDGFFAKKMQKRIEKKEDEEYIEKGLEKLFSDKKIPKPILKKKYYWPCGEGLWKKHTDYTAISKEMIQPFPHQSLFIIGENYSLHQGWIEGALSTAHAILSK